MDNNRQENNQIMRVSLRTQPLFQSRNTPLYSFCQNYECCKDQPSCHPIQPTAYKQELTNPKPERFGRRHYISLQSYSKDKKKMIDSILQVIKEQGLFNYFWKFKMRHEFFDYKMVVVKYSTIYTCSNSEKLYIIIEMFQIMSYFRKKFFEDAFPQFHQIKQIFTHLTDEKIKKKLQKFQQKAKASNLTPEQTKMKFICSFAHQSKIKIHQNDKIILKKIIESPQNQSLLNLLENPQPYNRRQNQDLLKDYREFLQYCTIQTQKPQNQLSNNSSDSQNQFQKMHEEIQKNYF